DSLQRRSGGRRGSGGSVGFAGAIAAGENVGAGASGTGGAADSGPSPNVPRGADAAFRAGDGIGRDGAGDERSGLHCKDSGPPGAQSPAAPAGGAMMKRDAETQGLIAEAIRRQAALPSRPDGLGRIAARAAARRSEVLEERRQLRLALALAIGGIAASMLTIPRGIALL